MSQSSDTRQTSDKSGFSSAIRAPGFLRRHRFGLLGAGLLGVLAVAGIANAGPIATHATCCMGHHHEGASEAAPASPDASGHVSITADGRGFHPASVEISKGQKTTLEFRRTSDETCATSVVFPELKLEKALPLNQTVAIELPASVSSTLTFQCGMGMYHGKVVVR